jgi:hypothetical protein
MNLIQHNKLSQLHNGRDIFFSQGSKLFSGEGGLLKELATVPQKLILITANDDMVITDELVEKLPPNVSKWFATNANSTSHKVIGLPLGVENTEPCKVPDNGMSWPHAIEKPEVIRELNKHPLPAEREVYANFSLRTNSERRAVLQIINSLDWINSTDCGENVGPRKHHKTGFGIPYKEFASNIQKHKMILSPDGNGVDCHRTWETLYLNRVPIVKKSPELNCFSPLPILFLDNWGQIKDKEFILQEYEKVKNNSREMLDCDYWINKITEEHKLLRVV